MNLAGKRNLNVNQISSFLSIENKNLTTVNYLNRKKDK